MLNQVYANKMSMSQAFSEGKRIPLTVLSIDPHTVLGTKTAEKDGYTSVIMGLGTKTKKGKTSAKKVKEIITSESMEKDSQLNLAEILLPGTVVNVTAASKGKGFAGVMKRWGFAGGPRTHGQSDRGRAPGSIGRGTTPGRVLPGTHMAGRMGNTNVCIRNLRVFSFDPETNILKITGAIPGGRGALAKITVTKLAENK